MERITNADMKMLKMVSEENKHANDGIFSSFKPNPLSKTRTYEGIEAYTFPIGTNFNVMEVTVGTNGHQGGDAGHGGRLFITLKCIDCECFGAMFKSIEGSPQLDIAIWGDDEIDMFCKCLRMTLKAIEIQLKGIEDDKKCIYGLEEDKIND